MYVQALLEDRQSYTQRSEQQLHNMEMQLKMQAKQHQGCLQQEQLQHAAQVSSSTKLVASLAAHSPSRLCEVNIKLQ